MHLSIPFISITGAAKEAVSSPSQRLEKPLIEKPAGSSSASASARLHRQASTRKDTKQLVSVAPSAPKCKANDLKRVFHYFDVDGDGKISPAELQSCMRTLGEELSAADVEAVVQSTDTDGDGLLGIEDFVRLMEVEEEERKRDLREAFGMYAMEGSGCITPKSLKRMLSRLGEKKTTEECKFMITQFDLDGDGVLSFEEFKVMML
ncbi:putative calcium-binding protein CML19 [Cinnamomum micranthum f. kanehirae]|uniref:Putative calcium-binding protein CML19 n=1 Tax=Cinnamomum micranthum f. kanehirae TaxID=337451 RepID=A0A3S3MKY6_9MAGN|nr:putative calcium-binding protein CML19 [Cinnamomum micranthum f. kanehirae]